MLHYLQGNNDLNGHVSDKKKNWNLEGSRIALSKCREEIKHLEFYIMQKYRS